MEIYLVGGAVRDDLLGYPFTEKDWVVVGARAEDLLEQGYTPVGRDFPVFLHPDSKEEFALARTERKQGHGYTGFDVHAAPDVTLEEDLKRRDLTINAMARDPDGRLIDPYGGQRDLAGKVLRHVSPAFVEDPLRVLRTARFAARYAHLGFTVAPETLALMAEIVAEGELTHLPAERVWVETEKALREADPAVYFSVLKGCGALAALAPELDERSDAALDQLAAAAARSDDSALRFAVLTHGLAPPALERLCERLKVPRRHRELALLLAAQAERAARAGTLGGEELLVLLEAAGALRDHGRFEDFLEGAAALAGEGFPDDYLRRARERVRDVSAAPFVAEGLSGKAIGRAMEAERIRRLEALRDSFAGE
ncbi:MAG: hypothetical protein ACX93N_09670 [Pseudohaliea sp.]